MRNYFEPGVNGEITVYLQRKDGEQLTTTISLVSLLKLRDVDERFLAMYDPAKKRTVVISVKRRNNKASVRSMHRLLIDVPQGMHVYHKDKNGLNNRLDNLYVDVHGATLNKPRDTTRPPYKASPASAARRQMTEARLYRNTEVGIDDTPPLFF